MEFRNALFSGPSMVDCEIDHPNFGWIPFTASPDDTEALGVEIYNAATKLNLKPYVAPKSDPNVDRAALPPLSRRQVFIGLVATGLITETEALLASTTMPALVEAAIRTLPKEAQSPARLTFALFVEAKRMDPIVSLLGAAAGMNEEALDNFWTTFVYV